MLRAVSSAVDEVRAGRNPLDEGGLVGLFATPEQRGVLGQVQALMSVLEGHGNVVMDDLGREYVAGQERMSRVLSQRRQIGGVTGLLHKLLGIEQKMRQYEVGEKFVRGVYEIAGRRAFDVVWQAPENLPTVPELSAPELLAPARRRRTRVNLSPALDDLADGAPVVVGCSGGADSLALLALACGHGLDVHAVYVDHGLRAGTGHDAATVIAAGARFGARVRVEHVDVGAGSESRVAGARRALCGARAGAGGGRRGCDPRRAHARRPGGDGVAPDVARRGCDGSGGHGAGAGIRPPSAARAPAPGHARVVRAARSRTGPRPHERRTPSPARLAAPGGHSPTRARRRSRSRRGARAPGRTAARRRRAARDARRRLRSRRRGRGRGVAARAGAARRTALADHAVGALGCDRRACPRGRERARPAPPSFRAASGSSAYAAGSCGSGSPAIRPVPSPLAVPGEARFADVRIEAWIEHGAPAAWPDGRVQAVCDADRVPDAVTVRAAAPGERFRPLGRSGSKLVRDAFAEAGITASRRAAAPVVAADEPVWVVGYRIDHRVRVTTGTRRFLWLSAEPVTTCP